MRRKNFYNAKKKKFAVYQTALTALFITLMVVFNAGIYAIADHFRWYIDMTEGQVFSLYPETKELLKAVEEDMRSASQSVPHRCWQ